MLTINNVHLQFAAYFNNESLKPYAFIVAKKLNEGHICVRLNEINSDEEFVKIFGLTDEIRVKNTIEKIHEIGTADDTVKPFILHNNNLYLQRYFYYETLILNRIKQFVQNEEIKKADKIKSLQSVKETIAELFPAANSSLVNGQTNWQYVAAVNSVINDFSIITGGPGTGKTTTVAKILALLLSVQPDCKIALAAPTGKAATRMAEALKANAKSNLLLLEKINNLQPVTLHQLLKISKDSSTFYYSPQNPLNYDLIIVDESSMIDVAIFAKLLHATGDNTRLILLGDKNQLASVEAGSMFGDLCKSLHQINRFSIERINTINSLLGNNVMLHPEDETELNTTNPLFDHIVELQHSYRFNSEEGIGKLSQAVLNNSTNAIDYFIKHNNHQQVLIDEHFNDNIFEQFVSEYEHYINEPDIAKAIEKLNSARVLCATNEGRYGVHQINKRIESVLRKKGLIKTSGDMYENRPIIITKNHYELKLFNGDIGLLRADEQGNIYAWFVNSDQQLVKISTGFISNVETVFAMTIHRSQGSEFDKILILLPELREMELMTKELLYTAVTRAKKSVIIQGKSTVIHAVASRSVKRISGIIERLQQSVFPN